MRYPIIAAVLLAAFILSFRRGPKASFAWIFLPVFALVPIELLINLPGLPELTARRAASAGLIGGAILSGRGSSLIPRWRLLDLLPLTTLVSFSISYGLNTDFMGFVHRVAVLVMDWALPYVFVRSLWRSYEDARDGLMPFAFSVGAMAVLAILEARLAVRFAREIWGALAGAWVPGHFPFWRWGYLRAFGTFSYPINLGVFLATVTPLVILWGQLEPKRKLWSWGIALACALGCFSSISRGPMVALIGAVLIGFILSIRTPVIPLLLGLAVLAGLPFLMAELSESIEYTQRSLDQTGNVESGYYRLALLMIYGDAITQVGWFGDTSLIGAKFEKAWSIDNSYLYFFFTGGWLGGGLILMILFGALLAGIVSVYGSKGAVRRVKATTMASFLAIVLGMFNVWFHPDYSPMFFICSALVLNQTQASWFKAKKQALASPSRLQRRIPQLGSTAPVPG